MKLDLGIGDILVRLTEMQTECRQTWSLLKENANERNIEERQRGKKNESESLNSFEKVKG